jgi:hypothetical protein
MIANANGTLSIDNPFRFGRQSGFNTAGVSHRHARLSPFQASGIFGVSLFSSVRGYRALFRVSTRSFPLSDQGYHGQRV